MAIRIQERSVGGGAPCFIIAELSGNHHQKYEEAVALVEAAKDAGADAVKLQTYTPNTITLNSDKEWFRVGGEDNPALWKGKTLYELYSEAYTPWEWQPKLKKIADELGIILFSTPFDETAVDFLELMHVPCYKIASYEATDFVLLRKVARMGKPVIISVGYASVEEIMFALETLRAHGAKEIAVLHCVAGYSQEPRLEDMHLSTIADIRKRFGVEAGFSDNNAGIEISALAAASGASIIEKHLILSRANGGPDAKFSLEPAELRAMIRRIRSAESRACPETRVPEPRKACSSARSRVGDRTVAPLQRGRDECSAARTRLSQAGKGFGTRSSKEKIAVPKKALGTPHFGPVNALEEYNKRFRRSLFAGRDIKKRERFTKENVRDVRPAFGLETKYYDEVIGKRATRNIPFATPLAWEMIEK